MTVHVNGSDLARVYAAGVAASNSSLGSIDRQREAGAFVQHFLDTLEAIDGKPPQVGDPFVWDSDAGLPRRTIDAP